MAMSGSDRDIFWDIHRVKSLRDLEKMPETLEPQDNKPLSDEEFNLDILKDLNGG